MLDPDNGHAQLIFRKHPQIRIKRALSGSFSLVAPRPLFPQINSFEEDLILIKTKNIPFNPGRTGSDDKGIGAGGDILKDQVFSFGAAEKGVNAAEGQGEFPIGHLGKLAGIHGRADPASRTDVNAESLFHGSDRRPQKV